MKYLIFLFLFSYAFTASSQCASCLDDVAMAAFNNPIIDYNNSFVEASGRNSKAYDVASTETHLSENYLEDFTIANFKSENKSLFVNARYNPTTNEMEIKLDEGIINLNKLEGFSLEFNGSNKKYECISYRDENDTLKTDFFELISMNSTKVYKKDYLLYVKAKKAVTSYDNNRPASYDLKTTYFYKDHQNNMVALSLKKKKIKSSFPKHGKEVLAFINKNGFKKETDQNLIRLVGYINHIELLDKNKGLSLAQKN